MEDIGDIQNSVFLWSCEVESLAGISLREKGKKNLRS